MFSRCFSYVTFYEQILQNIDLNVGIDWKILTMSDIDFNQSSTSICLYIVLLRHGHIINSYSHITYSHHNTIFDKGKQLKQKLYITCKKYSTYNS